LPLLKEVTSPALKAIKGAHTIVWAAFAGCILAIPVASWRSQHRVAGWLTAIVAGEVAVLVLNRWRCPLTSVAARYTDDRRDNFDIYATAVSVALARRGLPDVLDYPSIEAAMQAQEVVLCALGHKRFVQPTRILSEGTRNILRAIETHGRRVGSVVRTVRISRADVADFMLDQMTDNTYLRAAPGVCW
jgi:hypothetical protein